MDGGSPERLAAAGISFEFEPWCGFLARMTVTYQGQTVAPLHAAPWLGEMLANGTPPHLQRLQGDFFCAPFGQTPAGTGLHGWPANGLWEVTESDGFSLVARLAHEVSGATLSKHITLRDGHPFVYQRHVFAGGTGSLPAANHAMVSLPDGGLISTSPKRAFRTPANAPETDPARGRSQLAYPAQTDDSKQFPAASGSVDLTRYPWGPAHEECVVAFEANGSHLGWTAVVRPRQGDAYISLRNPLTVPATMFWHSNGGRDYAPWSGRHRHCLGVEEGFPGAIIGEGDPDAKMLALRPDGETEMRHVIGAIAWPTGERIVSVTIEGDSLTIAGENGAKRTVPVDAAHLALDTGSAS